MHATACNKSQGARMAKQGSLFPALHGTTWETDRRTDGQTQSSAAGQRTAALLPALPAAHRLPAGSIWWKILTRGAEGNPPLCAGRWDRGSERAPASNSLVMHCVPMRLLREINVVEFVSTDGGRFSLGHFTDTSRTSPRQRPHAADNAHGEQA